MAPSRFSPRVVLVEVVPAFFTRCEERLHASIIMEDSQLDYPNLRDKAIDYPNLRDRPICPLCGEAKARGPVVCPTCHRIHDLRQGLLPSIKQILGTVELDAALSSFLGI